MLRSNNLGMDGFERLKGVILTSGIRKSPVTSEHELLRIKQGKISIVVYKSGKMVYEDNADTMKIINQIFVHHSEYDYELGSDEVGKGEWYGPLIAVCTALKPNDVVELQKMGVKDSKQLSIPEIHRLADQIRSMNILFTVTILSPPTYNEMIVQFKKENKNLNELLAWAHSAAIKATIDKLQYQKIRVVIDKFDVEKTFRRLYGGVYILDKEKVEIIQKSKGESEIPVAASSIIAKDIFEKEVDAMGNAFGMNFRKMNPQDLPKSILEKVAKLHFKNIQQN